MMNESEDCALEFHELYHVIVPRDAAAERLALQHAIARATEAAKKPLTLGVFYAVALTAAEGLWGDADLWPHERFALLADCTARMWCSIRATREAQVLRENTPRYAPLLGLKVSA